MKTGMEKTNSNTSTSLGNTSTSLGRCPVCSSTDISRVFEIPEVPIHCNLLLSTRQKALDAPKGDIQLGFCLNCGHIFNLAFNPNLMKYTPNYENSLHFSPCFHSYAELLADRLIKRYDLYGKNIIEIGCGQGEFLALLCELGGNQGIGFDPGFIPKLRGNENLKRVTFIQDFYSKRYAHYKADMICCRHVLEHIHNPKTFMTMLRRTIGSRSHTIVFFEVPNALFILNDLAIWDIIYEHCSYFSPHSLKHLFTSCGFELCDLTETYQNQFLCIEVLPGKVSAINALQDNLNEMAESAARFAKQYREKVNDWHHILKRLEKTNKRVVIWGAGSKGITFLNTLKIQDQIKYVVDINPRKHSMYVAGTGQQIVPPEFLQNYQPEVVLVMNAIYKSEIQKVIDNLGLTVDFLCP